MATTTGEKTTTPIPLLDLKSQYRGIKDEVDPAIAQVLDSARFIMGPDVAELEKEVAAYCGTEYGVGCASGTDALILALDACNIGPGDEVITTPFTFIATIEAICQVGATPVFADIDPHTYNIDPEDVARRITKKTKALLPVHLYGQSADMDPLLELANKHKLRVVEDTAQAIGAEYKGRRAGGMGDIGCHSFFPSKNLGGFGDGGMVTTDDEELAERVRMLRVHGAKKKYYHEVIGYNSRLDTVQAAILRVKLRHLDGWTEGRRRNAKLYDKHLGADIERPYVPEGNTHVFYLYTISAPGRRDAIQAACKAAGIASVAYYPVALHLQPVCASLGYKEGDFPVSEEACTRVLSLPMFPELSEGQIARIAEVVNGA